MLKLPWIRHFLLFIIILIITIICYLTGITSYKSNIPINNIKYTSTIKQTKSDTIIVYLVPTK